MRRFAARVRDRLLLLVLFAILPTLVLTLYTNLEERRSVATDVRANALRLARITARSHEREVAAMRQLLATLAQLSEPRRGAEAICHADLAALVRQSWLYANVGVLGPDGQVLCSAGPLPPPPNAAERKWFEQAVRTREFAVGEYEIDRAGGRAVIVGGQPVLYPGGGTRAVVFTSLRLAWLDELAAAARLPERWTITVSDRTGAVLGRYPAAARDIGRVLPEASVIRAVLAQEGEGTAEVSGADGVERFFAFTALPGAGSDRGAYVSISVRRDAAFVEADRALRRNLMGLAIVAVAALLAVWLGSNVVLTDRLNALVGATKRLSAGDLRARADVRGGDEIGTLAHAFNVMAERLADMVQSEQRANAALADRVNGLVAQRTHEVTLLTQMSELLQACFTPEEAYAVLGKLIGHFFPEDEGAVFVLTSSRDMAHAVAAWGPSRASDRPPFRLDECWALRRGGIYSLDEAGSTPICPHLGSSSPAAYLCVPLAAQGEILGVLHLTTGPAGPDGEPAALPATKKRLATTVAEQFAMALANLRLRETLRVQSIRDPLTGLFNRRYMEETLDRELSRAARDRHPLAVIVIDLDRFKEFNDTFGHDAGDAVLTELGVLLRSHLRAGDIPCRFGGEEFALILPDAGLRDGERRAEELRGAIKLLRVSYRGRLLGLVCCSFGVSAFPDHGTTGEALLQVADAAMYRAKAAGRDQVVVAG